MKIVAVTFAAVTLLAAAPGIAEAKPGGCLKYGLGGAIAGHFAGGHRWKGAAAGCALGILQRRRHESAQQQPPRRMDRDERREFDQRRERNDDRIARDRRSQDPEDTGSVRRRSDFETNGNFARPRERSY
jgi:hypothetical protein